MLLDHFFSVAEVHAASTAIVSPSSDVTYHELAEDIKSLSSLLDGLGLGQNRTIALQGVNSIDFVVAYLAAGHAGMCVVPIDARLSFAEINALIADCSPAAAITFHREGTLGLAHLMGSDNGQQFEGIKSRCTILPNKHGDPRIQVKKGDLVIHYSSGSTGKPKGIILSHSAIFHKVNNWNMTLGITPSDVFLCTLTLTHCYGMYIHVLAALLSGARVYLPDLNTISPGRIAQMIKQFEVTVFGTLPYMYKLFLRLDPRKVDLGAVRYMISGSAPLASSTASMFNERFGRNINQVYGLTETGLICFNKDAKHPMSLGQLTVNMEARILNDYGEDAAIDEPGELVVRCQSMAREYLNSPAETQVGFRGGWFHTKDIVRCDANGGFYMCGRLSEFINVGGNKVLPAEVENVLLNHDGVADVAVLGRRNEDGDEEVVAFVIRRPEAFSLQYNELLQYCSMHLAPYKLPRSIRFVDEFPKSPVGKVLKSALSVL